MRLGYHYHNVGSDIVSGAEMVGIVAVAIVASGVLCYLLDRGDPQC